MEPHEWSRLRGEIQAAAKADHTRHGEVARWFLVSSENRPLLPGSARSRREVVDKLVTPDAGPVQIGRAHELDSTNLLARRALARFEADPERAKQRRDSALQRLPVPAPSDLQRRIDALLRPR